ncbi:Phophatidylserine decarboxylase-domain-containing protein [Xylaria bambusicola]|uniref:Phophatidylserine decarboxylase-domain-containing protein n=1 Tax=Xylaria bambusicola TaxID=326684 RepID=UPI00200805BD|nr:Phophatidylserine decarboxylase-domain-containing protein [Xylaria bambusicola]KAI0517434.1 Phophatidylserine decarboxylase-domain-containing protein [Xylaria bambusicola]
MVHQHGDEAHIPDEHKVHRVGAWLPADHRVQHDWLAKHIEHLDNNPPQPLSKPVQEFKEFIEGNTRIYMYFQQMWEEVPMKKPYYQDPTGKKQIRSYEQMLALLNRIFTQAPHWNDTAYGVGMVGVPLCSIFDYVMSTPSGHAAFLDPDVNKMLKKILNEWGKFLQTPESAVALSTETTGWFSDHGRKDLMEVANAPLQTNHSFEELFICDPKAKHHGYKSWDDFFTRQFREGVRPVASLDDDNVIANACESTPYNLARNSSLRAQFWVKGQPYSILDMLAHDPLSAQFDQATVYQAFLSALSYHRWHSPVSGKIVRAFVQDGTYFSEPLFTHTNTSSESSPETTASSLYSINASGLSQSQSYLTNLATRAVIFIQADNPAIGLLAFVGVGMDEVSTCEITVRQGQHISKGDQLGMFHFGGSTHCVLFRKDVQVTGFPEIKADGSKKQNVPVRSKLAVVKNGGRS